MTIFNKIAATALAVVTAFGSASAAYAKPALQPFNREGSRALLDTVKADGVKVFIDEEFCFKEENRRLLGVATSDERLLLCVKNHGGDYDELADTLRHEVVHLAQYCKGRLLGTTIATIHPQHSRAYVRHAIEELNMPTQAYDRSKWAVEAEARVFAQYLDDAETARLYNDFCVRPYQRQLA